MSIVVCWFQRTLKQLEREQTDTQTDTQDDYSNPRACVPRVNKLLDSVANSSEQALVSEIGVCEVIAEFATLCKILIRRTHSTNHR